MMTEDVAKTINYEKLWELADVSQQSLVVEYLWQITLLAAPVAASHALRVLKPGGTLEFSLPDFGQMISLYDRSMGVNEKLREALWSCRGQVWDERGIAKVLLEAGFYRVWTGVVPEAQPCWMWVKAIKFDPGADIDAQNGTPQGRAGEG